MRTTINLLTFLQNAFSFNTYKVISACLLSLFFAFTLSADSGYGLHVECPDDIYVGCDDHYQYDHYDHYGLPLPKVSTDCGYCYDDHISGFIYMGTKNGHSYYCSKEKMTWHDAKAYCESKGGYLAVINDHEENYFLSNSLLTEAAYIGLSDHQYEGHFKWVNGEPMTYENWYQNQPNNYYDKQHYVELLKNGYWNDQYYYKPLEFIMEIPCYSITKVYDSYHTGSYGKKRTIKYKIKDACGRVETCQFNINYHDYAQLECPSDIQVYTNSGSAIVSWKPPVFDTCCDECYEDGHHIDGYIYMGSYKGSKYYCSKQNLTWPEAKAKCEQNGGYLAIIDNEGENKYISSHIMTQYAYIGVSDHQKEGDWKTVHGDKPNYMKWYPGEPDNSLGKQHYVEINKYGYWNDQYKHKKREYVMEIPECSHVYQVAGPSNGSEFPVGKTKVAYKAKDGCGNEDYCSFYVTVKNKYDDAEYCEIWGKNTTKGYIDKVSLNNKWFNSGNNWGYEYHDGYCVSAYRGKYLYFKFKPGYNNSYSKAYFKLYLDSNRDGDFDDPYEYLGKASGYGYISGKIPISDHVKLGKTRLRLVMKIGGYPNYTCGLYEYGETEDFCIYVREYKSLTEGEIVTGTEAIIEEIEEIEPPTESIGRVTAPLNVYPNPAVDRISIHANISDNSLAKIDIISASGQIAIEVPWRNEVEKDVDISQLPPGVYFLRAVRDTGNVEYKKFVKR